MNDEFEEVLVPDYVVTPHYTPKKRIVTIDTYTEVGRAKYIVLEKRGLNLRDILLKQMVEGIDFTRKVIDYVPFVVKDVSQHIRPRYAFKNGNKYQTRK